MDDPLCIEFDQEEELEDQEEELEDQ